MTPFVHLHIHSYFSPMRGVSSITALAAAVRAQGGATVALTDTNGLYGAVRFFDVAREAGLQPIVGTELTTEQHRAVLLAKTAEGYGNLCRILSARHCDPSFDFIDTVARYRRGLILLTDDEPALSAWSQDSREDLYVELTPGPGMHHSLLAGRRMDLPPVATNRVHFVRPDEFAVHRLLRTIALNTTLSRLPSEACCSPTQWLMPPSAMSAHFPHAPHAIENTVRIADACHTDWSFRDTIFPAFRRLSNEEAFTLLRDKTYEGARQRYGTVSPDIRRRAGQELSLIYQKGFAHYFLIVEEIVRQAPRTCGRGSVAASIVSYCLHITHVDPLRHNLFFERFLNPGRKDPPDIDIDFPWDERDDIINWVFRHYGSHRAAMVANQNTLGLRAAIRETAKVHGIPPAEIGRVSALIMRRKELLWFDEAPSARVWADRLSQALQLNEPWPLVIRSAAYVQDHFRHLSVHCGGVVIVPDEIRRYVPVEIAAKGVPVIQWEKGSNGRGRPGQNRSVRQ